MQGLIASAVRNTGLHGANLGNMFKTVFGSIHSDKAVAELEAIGVKMTEVGKDGTKSWRPVNDVLREMMILTANTSRDTEELTKAASGGKEFAAYDKKLSYKKLHEPRNLGCVA